MSQKDGTLRGRALILPDDAAADLLHPPRHYGLDSQRVAAGAFAGLPEVASLVTSQTGPWILVAGRDLGAGSSRETTLYALRDRGVVAAVADSASRIFTRNAWNVGLPVVEIPGASMKVGMGEEIGVEVNAGRLCRADGTWLQGEIPDPYFLAMFPHGGLLGFLEFRGIIPSTR